MDEITYASSKTCNHLQVGLRDEEARSDAKG